jgi:hypothetical protein
LAVHAGARQQMMGTLVKVQNITSEHATSVAVTGACKVTPCAKFIFIQILLTCLSRVREHLSVPLSFYHSANFTAHFSLSVWDWGLYRSLLNYGNSRVFSSKPGQISCAKGVMLCEQYDDNNIRIKIITIFVMNNNKPNTIVTQRISIQMQIKHPQCTLASYTFT